MTKLLLSFLLQFALFAGLLLVPAGTWWWWRAWVFIGVMCVVLPVAALAAGAFPTDADFLNERLKSPIQRGQPLADKIFVLLFLNAFLGFMVFIPVDVFRFNLLGEPSPVIAGAGLVAVVVGWWIVSLASKENAFAAPVVKYQEARHQRVIDTGPYAVVRHPMYAGGVLLFLGIPLWLGSYAGVVVACVPSAAIVVRIQIEERFLMQSLSGYAGYARYARRVRYRLVPFLW